MDILQTIDYLELHGVADKTEDGSARLKRPVTVGGVQGDAMVYTNDSFALIVFRKPVAGSPGKSEYRSVLLDSFGAYGRRGGIYLDVTTATKAGKVERKAVPGVKKYIQPCADVMAMRVDKRQVARDQSADRVTDHIAR